MRQAVSRDLVRDKAGGNLSMRRGGPSDLAAACAAFYQGILLSEMWEYIKVNWASSAR